MIRSWARIANGFAILAVAFITTRASWAMRRERAAGATTHGDQALAPTTDSA